VAVKTGDSVGGLLNATLGNLTELVIALTALRAGQYTLVKASVAGAIVAKTLFLLGGSFLLGGLKHHVQEYNRLNARLQTSLLFLATIAMLIPSAVLEADSMARQRSRRNRVWGYPCCLFLPTEWVWYSHSRHTARSSLAQARWRPAKRHGR
jgi:Ca2+:H+ antiporter